MKTLFFYNVYTNNSKELFDFIITQHKRNDSSGNIKRHSHDMLELNYIKSGKGKYVINQAEFDILPGDVFIINPTDYHSLEIHSDDFLIYVIHCHKEYICPDENIPTDMLFLKPFHKQGVILGNRLDRDNDMLPSIQNLFLEIEKEIVNSKHEYQIFVKTNFLYMLSTISRYFVKSSEQFDMFPQDYVATIMRVLSYMDLCIAEDVTLEELSARAHMSPTYFSKFFKKVIGMSPFQYVQKRRVERATELLKNTNKSIVEIAEMCGFPSTSGFYKIFKKITGSLPSNIRKRKDIYANE